MALKILVVDDEPQVLDVFRKLVEPLGYEVLTLADSREAARRIAEDKFDAIALDAVMPRPDGFELTERIRASSMNPSVPIIMFTGHDSVAMMRRGFQAGITFFLAKPLSPEKLRGLFSVARGAALEERRRYVRLPHRTVVECRCAGQRHEARSIDVARGGILLECTARMDTGQVIEMEFSLPGARQPLRLLGKVIRGDPSGRVAVEFIEPEPQDRDALERFVVAGTKE
ncbi:MAG: response regulator [Terriglobia bacterium]